MRRTQFKVVDSMKLPRAARFETSTFTEPDMKKIPDSLASELLGQLLVDQNSNGWIEDRFQQEEQPIHV